MWRCSRCCAPARRVYGSLPHRAGLARRGRELLLRLQPDVVVDGNSKLLLAAEEPLGGLDVDVTEQKFNLLQFAAGDMTQTGASTPQVMRR